MHVLREIESANWNFRALDLFPVFCAEEICGLFNSDKVPLYRDTFSHPSVEANYLARHALLAVVKHRSKLREACHARYRPMAGCADIVCESHHAALNKLKGHASITPHSHRGHGNPSLHGILGQRIWRFPCHIFREGVRAVSDGALMLAFALHEEALRQALKRFFSLSASVLVLPI